MGRGGPAAAVKNAKLQEAAIVALTVCVAEVTVRNWEEETPGRYCAGWLRGAGLNLPPVWVQAIAEAVDQVCARYRKELGETPASQEVSPEQRLADAG